MKFGRLARKFESKIPHMSAILGSKKSSLVPQSIDWTKGIQEFGMMINDKLGCCTCAAVYHARQIWTLNSSSELTENDNCVEKLYEEACGYNPADPSTDNGGVEQDVLTYLLKNGYPLSDGSVDKIIGFMEVDPRNINDIKQTIFNFGVCYIGFDVPDNLMENGNPPKLWNNISSSKIDGGHAVILVGYDEIGFTVISWGSVYKMSYDFFLKYTDEAYAILSKDWLKNTGISPLGLTTEQLESLMKTL